MLLRSAYSYLYRMKFRTEIEIRPYDRQLSYDDRLLALGSCFATEIGRRLAEAKFRIAVNPSGVLFNPLSVVRALRRYHNERPVAKEELQQADGRWFHYDFHGSLSGATPDEALTRINTAVAEGTRALREASVVLLTLGTAWVYERTDTGDAVANCHKQPADRFRRRRLTVEEIVSEIENALSAELSGKQILLTVSPVRHLGDGLTGNTVSKAVLRLAAEELTERHAQIAYFPAYEILCDDLRDYRFYADDLVHPSSQAVAYIWKHFCEALLTPDARHLLPRIAEVTAAARHRPLHPTAEAYRAFCRRQLEVIDRLPEADFTEETAFFRRQIEINS